MGVTYTTNNAQTYELIQSYTVATDGVKTITMSSIPSTYTDLVTVISLRRNTGGGAGPRGVLTTFNSDTGATNYGYTRLYWFDTTPGADSGEYSDMEGVQSHDTSHVGGNVMICNSYQNTNFHKQAFVRNWRGGSATKSILFNGGRWKSTNAITSFSFDESNEGFKANDVIYIYGILRA